VIVSYRRLRPRAYHIHCGVSQTYVPSFRIRSATEHDAAQVGALAEEFADYLRGIGDHTDLSFNAEAYLRDGFGSNPAFAGIVAESQGTVLGYLLYHPGYDTDRGVRLLPVLDLYVREAARRRGVGRALMTEAAAICKQQGGKELIWSVYEPNKLAAECYEQLGARYIGGLRFMTWPV